MRRIHGLRLTCVHVEVARLALQERDQLAAIPMYVYTVQCTVQKATALSTQLP